MPFDVKTTDEFNEWYGFIVDDYDRNTRIRSQSK